MSDVTRPPFDIGRVLERLFATAGRNFLVFFGLALLLVALPGSLLSWITAQRMTAGAGGDVVGLGLLYLAGGVGGAISSFILQAAIVHGAVMDLNGRKPDFADCLSGGLRRFLPVLAISILMSLAVVIGLLLFIVPGVLMLLAWAVVIPVAVVENKGPFESFGRSRDLTRGRRGLILLLLIIWIIVTVVISSAITGVGLALVAGRNMQNMVIIQGFISPVANSLSAVISATGVAALYYELRRIKEGIGPEALAAIFD